MAITYAELTAQGKDAWAAMTHGTMITDFTFAMQESPEISKQLIKGYSDPLYKQIMMEASIARGATSSDQNRWYESGRIQNSYERSVLMTTVPLAGASGTLTFPAGDNFDIRTGQTILVSALAADITGAADLLEEFYVVSIDAAAKTAVVQSREGASSDFVAANVAVDEVLTVSHLASDFKQGSGINDESVTKEGTWISNNPIILKDYQKYDRSKLQHKVLFSDDLTRYSIDTKDMDTRFEIQQILALIFGKKSQTGTLKTAGILGAESLVAGVEARGNTASGSWAAKSDLDNLVKMLNSVKGSRKNKLMLNLAKGFEMDAALASVTSYDANTYNYGMFSENVNYRELGFEGFTLSGGWEFMKGHWDILDDTTYFGAHAGNSNLINGLLIPEGSVETYEGGSVPYIGFHYRDGMSKQVGKNGAVFGIGHDDVASISYTTEATLVGANLKDFVLFTG